MPKTTSYTEQSLLSESDILYAVSDPSGTPASATVNIANALNSAVLRRPGFGSANTRAMLGLLPVQPSFLLNVMDTSSMKLRRGAYFSGAGAPNTPYLEADAHSDFDTVTAFSVLINANKWKWVIAQGETYLAKAGASGNRSWWIGNGSSADENQDIQVWLYDSGDTESWGKVDYSGTNREDALKSQVLVVYDGTETGNENRLKIYYDGVQQTVTFNGTIPASLKDSTAPIRMGMTDAQTLWELNLAVLSHCAYWNVALTQADATKLWRLGDDMSTYEIRDHSSLSTGCVSAWPLDEDGGQRRDIISGHDLKCPTGVQVPSQRVITQWDEQIQGIEFVPATVASRNGYFSFAPWLVEDDANNLAVQFGKPHKMHALVEGPFTATSGEFYHVLKFIEESVIGTTEMFPFMVGNTEDATKYFGSLIQADLSNVFRVRDDTLVGVNGANESDHDLTLNELIINQWVGLGTGGASSFEHYVNGSQQTVSVMDEPDLWFGDQTQQRTIGLNCLSRSSTIEGVSSYHCGAIAMFDSVLSAGDKAATLAVLNAMHSVY